MAIHFHSPAISRSPNADKMRHHPQTLRRGDTDDIRERLRSAERGQEAYVSAAYCLSNPIPSGNRWTDRVDLNLEDVSWADGTAKSSKGSERGLASEAYASDGRFGLVCLPASFFRYRIVGSAPAFRRG
ncbi:hypothetical protein [Nonomuraea sp. NPDC049400]|uniref:hypothetical protein n=1 Tax=Nonomuraea sp. NPDC049400 TaxID=3364352 RepID=UPI0037B0F752